MSSGSGSPGTKTFYSGVIQVIRKSRFRLETRQLVFLALVLYWSLGLLNPDFVLAAAIEHSPPYVQALFTSFFSVFSATFLIIPLFLLYIRRPTLFYQKKVVVLRQGGPLKTARLHLFACFKTAALYLLFLYGLLLLAALIRGQFHNIPFPDYLLRFLLQFFVLTFLMQLVYLLLLASKNSVFPFLAVYGLCAVDYTLMMAALPRIPLFVWFQIYEMTPAYGIDLGAVILLNGFLFLLKALLLDKTEWYKPKSL